MGIQAPTEVKFRLIQEAAQKDGNKLNISALCRLAGVSRSGYYTWVNTASKRETLEAKDRADFALVQQAYEFRGYKKGARGIYMRLLHQEVPVVMNPKKIRRLMEKYGLVCPVSRENPYHRLPPAEETGSFPAAQRRILADITALPYSKGTAYFASMLDVQTREILAYDLSDTPRADFLFKTLETLQKDSGAILDEDVIVHNCRKEHLSSKAFVERLRDEAFVQSLTCRESSPFKSFFRFIDEELYERLPLCGSLEDLRQLMDDWIDYYNNDRYQWDLKLLSPREYSRYLQTGISPIAQGISKNRETSGSKQRPDFSNIHQEGACRP